MNALMNNEFTKWFMICVFQKYAEFNGRARRKEYWMFALVQWLVAIILMATSSVLGMIGIILYAVFMLGVLLPGLAVAVRRLHDVGKSGWFLLIALVPIVGPLYLLFLLISDSKPGENQYGPNPKGM